MRNVKNSLRPLWHLLERQELTALLRYAQSMAALERARNKQKTLERELEALCMLFTSKLNVPEAVSEVAGIQEYCWTVEKEKKLRERQVEAAQDQVQFAYAKLVAARKANAVVQHYYEIQKRQCQRTRRQHEQKSLDVLNQRPLQLPVQRKFERQTVWN